MSFTSENGGKKLFAGTFKSQWIRIFSLLFVLGIFASVTDAIPPGLQGIHVEDRDHWYSDAKSHIQMLLEAQKISKNRAKNVILFVGDGMGLTTITAGRILKGQKKGLTGEEYQLAFEKFPYLALAKTYTLDTQIGDSSACATALMCGVKANVNTLGLDNRGKFENCFSSFTGRATSIIEWAQKYGKSTGIVTNTRLTHGTPAALYAHSASRYWEDDSKMPEREKDSCKDIARQLVEEDPGKNINVLMGGGRRHWIPETEFDREARTETGRRTDKRNLVDDWIRDKKDRDLHAEYILNKAQFDEIDPRRTDYLLGLFGYSHLDFEADRNKGPSGDPSLAEMTTKSIQILQRNPHGFFLMVEAGRIDHANHHNNAARALHEVGALEEAVIAALSLTQVTDTLVVVTADHSHVFSFGGDNTPRGHSITGFDTEISDLDMKPYTTLLYANGPGYAHSSPSGRQNLTGIDPDDINFVQQTAVPRKYSTHSGEDVPVYAIGPGAHLFSGTVEQSYIPHAIAFAACISPESSHCEQPYSDDASSARAVPRPLYPRQHENHHNLHTGPQPFDDNTNYPNSYPHPMPSNIDSDIPLTPASAPVEERKRPGDPWTWITTSKAPSILNKWPPWGILHCLALYFVWL